MPAGVGHIGGATPAVAVRGVVVVEDLEPGLPQPRDSGVICGGRQVHRVVDVHTASAAPETDLRSPQSDPGSLARHQPDRAASAGPPLHHRKPQQAGVEALARVKVGHLQRDLAHTRHGQRLGFHFSHQTIAMKTQEMRLVLTVQDFDRTTAFFRDALGLAQVAEFRNDGGRAVLLDAGHATLEIFDESQAAAIDGIEVGRRVAGAVRLAFQTEDSESLAQHLADTGAEVIGGPVVTPWGDRNVRLVGPESIQLTLFTAQES